MKNPILIVIAGPNVFEKLQLQVIDFEEPKQLFRVKNGIIVKQYSVINDWANPIFEYLTKP
jgi:hypothetical protein